MPNRPGRQELAATQASATAMLDQIRAQVRDMFPTRSASWRDAWVLRAIHHNANGGGTEPAEDLPDEGTG